MADPLEDLRQIAVGVPEAPGQDPAALALKDTALSIVDSFKSGWNRDQAEFQLKRFRNAVGKAHERGIIDNSQAQGYDNFSTSVAGYLDQPSLTEYRPTLRDRIARGLGAILPERTVEGLAGSRGIGPTERNLGTGLVDFTPLGIPLAVEEAQIDAGRGNYVGAIMGATALIPGAKPVAEGVEAVGEAAAKGLKGWTVAESKPTKPLLDDDYDLVSVTHTEKGVENVYKPVDEDLSQVKIVFDKEGKPINATFASEIPGAKDYNWYPKDFAFPEVKTELPSTGIEEVASKPKEVLLSGTSWEKPVWNNPSADIAGEDITITYTSKVNPNYAVSIKYSHDGKPIEAVELENGKPGMKWSPDKWEFPKIADEIKETTKIVKTNNAPIEAEPSKGKLLGPNWKIKESVSDKNGSTVTVTTEADPNYSIKISYDKDGKPIKAIGVNSKVPTGSEWLPKDFDFPVKPGMLDNKLKYADDPVTPKATPLLGKNKKGENLWDFIKAEKQSDGTTFNYYKANLGQAGQSDDNFIVVFDSEGKPKTSYWEQYPNSKINPSKTLIFPDMVKAKPPLFDDLWSLENIEAHGEGVSATYTSGGSTKVKVEYDKKGNPIGANWADGLGAGWKPDDFEFPSVLSPDGFIAAQWKNFEVPTFKETIHAGGGQTDIYTMPGGGQLSISFNKSGTPQAAELYNSHGEFQEALHIDEVKLPGPHDKKAEPTPESPEGWSAVEADSDETVSGLPVLHSYWSEQLQKLTSPVRESVIAYTGSSYSNINQAVLGRTDNVHAPGRTFSRIGHLDQAMGELPEDMVLHRGMRHSASETLRDMKVGDIYNHVPFASTSRSKTGILNEGEGYKLVITAPKGTRGLAVEDLSDHVNEREVILARDTPMLIEDIDHDREIAHVRVLPEIKKETGNWQFPDEANIRQEYEVEYQNHLRSIEGDIFPSFDDWKEAVDNGVVVSISPEMDKFISGRSRTKDKGDLLNLIKSYRSYPEFRNEETLKNLYNRLENNEPLNMPIVYSDGEGRMRIVGGNTRLDAAFQMGYHPKILLIHRPTSTTKKIINKVKDAAEAVGNKVIETYDSLYEGLKGLPGDE